MGLSEPIVSVYTRMPAKPRSSEIAVIKSTIVIKNWNSICRIHTKLQFNVGYVVYSGRYRFL